MSNTRTISEFKPAGDMGIGLCLLCVAEAKATEPATRVEAQLATKPVQAELDACIA